MTSNCKYTIKVYFLCILCIYNIGFLNAEGCNKDIQITGDIKNTYPCGELSYEYGKTSRPRVPWLATVYRRTESVADRTDAALIINEFMVLMNANRFKQGELLQLFDFSSYTVSVNISRIDDSLKKNSTVQTVKVSHIEIHPSYNAQPWQWAANDIAVVYLDTPLKFDRFVHPICIPASESLVEKIITNGGNDGMDFWGSPSLFVSGWTRDGPPDNLVLNVNMNPHSTCKNWWQNNNETEKALYVNRFCVNVSAENEHTTCIHRDAGVFGKHNGRYFFLGFVNNFYSENRMCTSNTREFICQLTDSMLLFIKSCAKCGKNRDFACANGQCIPFSAFCDTKTNCEDGSDEKNAVCEADMNLKSNEILNEKNINALVLTTAVVSVVVAKVLEKCFSRILNSSRTKNNATKADVPSSRKVEIFYPPQELAAVEHIPLEPMEQDNYSFIPISNSYNTDSEVIQETRETFYNTTPTNSNAASGDYVKESLLYEENILEKFRTERNDFEILSILNEGNFGIVFDGKLSKRREDTTPLKIAIKTSKVQYRAGASLLNELKILQCLHNSEPINPNIVKLIGGSYDEKRQLYILMEICDGGNLLDFLRTKERRRQMFVDVLDTFSLQCSHDIAEGMDFLISKKVLHRDLSAKNILVSIYGEIIKIKIADFGLSVSLGDNQDVLTGLTLTDEELPKFLIYRNVRYCAIESFGGQWSEKSDVWSYGITLWEIFTLGKKPYDGLTSYDEIKKYLIVENRRLPTHWPDVQIQKIYDDVMMTCWDKKPELRPTFERLQNYFFECIMKFQSRHQ